MKKLILAYVYDDGAHPISEDAAKKLTHISIAFGLLQPDGSLKTEHIKMLSHLAELRKANPELEILLSVNSGHPDAFSVGSSTEAGRKAIAASCAQAVEQYGLDGIDLDWEYPCCPSNGITASPVDKENYTLLCREIRAALDSLRSDLLLTIAAGGGEYYLHFVDMPAIEPLLDYVFLMTYDLKCGFHALSGHHTNLYPSTGDVFENSCDTVLRQFHAAGVPLSKLAIGAAFYSREWKKLRDVNHGLLQLAQTGGGYGPNYSELVEEYIDKNGYVRYWDDEAKAPWLFNGEHFISYDDEESIRAKCEYIKQTDCAGIFYWQHTYDKTGRLLDAMAQGLK